MQEQQLEHGTLNRYREYLLQEEHALSTVEKYLRDLQAFAAWLDGRTITKELASAWKDHLLSQGRVPVTVNAKLSALNGLLKISGPGRMQG